MKKVITVMVIVCSTLSLFAQNETKLENSNENKGTQPLPTDLWQDGQNGIFTTSGKVGISASNIDPEMGLHIKGDNLGSSILLENTSPSGDRLSSLLFRISKDGLRSGSLGSLRYELNGQEYASEFFKWQNKGFDYSYYELSLAKNENGLKNYNAITVDYEKIVFSLYPVKKPIVNMLTIDENKATFKGGGISCKI